MAVSTLAARRVKLAMEMLREAFAAADQDGDELLKEAAADAGQTLKFALEHHQQAAQEPSSEPEAGSDA